MSVRGVHGSEISTFHSSDDLLAIENLNSIAVEIGNCNIMDCDT